MSTIFISYSRKDSVAAEDLKRQLEASGFDVWLDTTKIEAGYQWKVHVLDAIRTCSAMVVISTPQSSASHWVMREISYAVEFGKDIYPLVLKGDRMPIFSGLQCARTVDELIQSLMHLPQLFICHAPEDEKFAADLKDRLSKLGASIWQGELDDLLRNLKTTNVIMLLVISPESMKSDAIKYLRRAFDHPDIRKEIIPLLVRHSTVSPKLRGKPYIDFLNQEFATAFAQLYGRLEKLQGVKLNAYTSMPIPPQPPLLLDGIGMFRTANETVWISGLILDTFAPYHKDMSDALEDKPNLKVRILILKLDVKLANDTGDWVGINRPLAEQLDSIDYPGFEAWAAQQDQKLTPEGRWIALRLYKNQQDLKLLQAAVPDRVEIRATCHRPGMGYFIVDPHAKESEGILIASPYFYQIDKVKAASQVKYNTLPIFLSKSSSIVSDLWWFNQYVQEFERLWADSQKWEPV